VRNHVATLSGKKERVLKLSPFTLQFKKYIMIKNLIESIRPKKLTTVGKVKLPRWYTGYIFPKPVIWTIPDKKNKRLK